MKYNLYAEYTYNNETKGYYYSNTATYSEQIVFVKTVTNAIVSDDFIPLVMDIMFKYYLVAVFTDINVSELFHVKNENGELEFNIDAFAEFDRQTNIGEELSNNIDRNILLALEDSVEKNIAYTTGIHVDNITTAIVDLVKAFIKKAESVPDIDPELISSFLENVDTKGITKSVIEDYIKSDDYDTNTRKMLHAKDEEIAKLKREKNNYSARNVMADNQLHTKKK